MDKIITLENVTKSYNGKCVIDEVSHDFYKGQSIAFAGHNGCGKSTMLKILSGIIRINSGNIHYHDKVRFSYVPEKFPGLDVTMISYLRSVAGMEGVDFSEVERLIEEFFLEEMKNTRMNNMSKGSLQKVGVIQALMAPHDILILDEPLSGQDAESQEVFITKVNELIGQGVTVFMSCHEKKLMDEVSDSVYTINQGKLEKVENKQETFFKIYVRRNNELNSWSDMILHGNKYMITVSESELKKNVMKLFNEGWELVGIEEYI
ncbi:MAG: ABC transporter ATP-binding protein [Eubacterium sp.]|nr:ABC transporter ATP-binding protein [Eubacterium sp.]